MPKNNESMPKKTAKVTPKKPAKAKAEKPAKPKSKTTRPDRFGGTMDDW